MPIQNVLATIKGKEQIVPITIPDRFFTHTPAQHEARCKQLIAQRMSIMGATEWSINRPTAAAQADENALAILLKSRRDQGHIPSLAEAISPRRTRRQKRQKYPRR